MTMRSFSSGLRPGNRPRPVPGQGAAPIRSGRARLARRTPFALLAVAGLATVVPSSPSLADPSAVQRQKAQVQRLESQLAAIDAQAARAAEAYNGAQWRFTEAEKRIDANTRSQVMTRKRLTVAQGVLAGRLRDIYVNPPPSVVEVIVSTGSITGAVDGADMIQIIGKRDGAVVGGIRGDLDHLRTIRVQLVKDRATARDQVQEAARRRAEVNAILRRRQAVVNSARGELKRLIREEEARKRAEAAAQKRALEAQQRAAAAAQSSAGSGATATPSVASAPTAAVGSGSGNARVVSIAMQYLGVPYVWGGASPSGFDCSGLASYVYAQIGKSVPHYTGAIWAAFPKVAPGDLQPGDLVFFYSDLHHMGIYIGGGQFIHAPHTGDVVRVANLADRGSSFVGAVRP